MAPLLASFEDAAGSKALTDRRQCRFKETNVTSNAPNPSGAPACAALAEDTAGSQVWFIKTFGFLGVAALFLVFSSSGWARSAPDSFADLAERLLPSVVNVSTTQSVSGSGSPDQDLEELFRDFFERRGEGGGGATPPQQRRRASSLGSGFVIDPEGLYRYQPSRRGRCRGGDGPFFPTTAP